MMLVIRMFAVSLIKKYDYLMLGDHVLVCLVLLDNLQD